ncbi:SMI1/KNR4 family protein [Paenibacillus sp. alder61]|uniref:SMI1/KNR4 family protein n=1 Tax=Paenibacillus faecis TaxID=862114 RepID=A0A5D0CNA6_9BACL|nr:MULTISPECIES: SMI1/KNR4 family protein [Paenibacillus]MCA1295003.1 SMI1/KNR4 family protein [Paenibacillus sp. alder61]TYA10735.1 SMI1/KNR4 family protein [Paenibacillus faecis]
MGKFEIESTFSSTTAEKLVKFEKKYDLILPDDYKQFLLINNGGKTGPKRRFLTNDPTKEGEVESSILFFFPLTDETTSNLENIYLLYTKSNVIKNLFLPIGETPRKNIVCMAVKGENKGSVFHFDLGYDDYIKKGIELESEFIRFIASSFTEFIDGLFIANQ